MVDHQKLRNFDNGKKAMVISQITVFEVFEQNGSMKRTMVL